MLIARRFSEILCLLGDFIAVFDKIKLIDIDPYNNKEFAKVFDPQDLFSTAEAQICFTPSFIDITLDNLIVKEGKSYLIDNEWCFNFPVPKKYLLFRAIFQLSTQLQAIIQAYACPEFACIELVEGFVIPVKWLEVFNLDTQDIFIYINYENNLQKYCCSYSKELIPLKDPIIHLSLIHI